MLSWSWTSLCSRGPWTSGPPAAACCALVLGLPHHSEFVWCRGTHSGLCACHASTLPTQRHLKMWQPWSLPLALWLASRCGTQWLVLMPWLTLMLSKFGDLQGPVFLLSLVFLVFRFLSCACIKYSNKSSLRAGKITQWSRVLASLLEDQSLVPSTHIDQRTITCNSSCRDPMPLTSVGTCTCLHIPTCWHTHLHTIKPKNKSF